MGSHVKVGWSRSPWHRVAFGFHGNVHPTDLCGKLSLEDAELLFTWKCPDEATEKALHKEFASTGVGEFYPCHVFDEIILPKLCGLEKIELLKPSAEEVTAMRRGFDRQPIRRECCGGQPCVCFTCGKKLASFKGLGKHLLTHAPPAHKCERCEKPFSRRDHLVRHLKLCQGERPRDRSRSRD